MMKIRGKQAKIITGSLVTLPPSERSYLYSIYSKKELIFELYMLKPCEGF